MGISLEEIMISSKRRSSSPTPTIGQLTKSLAPETLQVISNTDLVIEFYARTQTRLIAELHNKVHRHQTPTWNTLLWDNQRYQALNALSSALFAGVSSKNLRLAVESVKSTASTGQGETLPTPGTSTTEQGTSNKRGQANINSSRIVIVPKRGDCEKNITTQRVTITAKGEVVKSSPQTTCLKAKSRKSDTLRKTRSQSLK